MANRPKKPCARPGCPALVESGERYCDKHRSDARRQQDSIRQSASKRGYDRRWRAYREFYLQAHPLCSHCYSRGIITPATIVDHIIPHSGDYDLFWDSENHHPLCKQCHDIKTASEDGAFGRARG